MGGWGSHCRYSRSGWSQAVAAKTDPDVRFTTTEIWADAGDKGQLIEWCWLQWQMVLEIVSPAPTQKGFAVLPKRWIVEPTFAWFGHYRRLSKDYEAGITISEGMVYLASIHTLLKRSSV